MSPEDKDLDRIIEELDALRAHQAKITNARKLLDQITPMIERCLSPDPDTLQSRFVGCREDGQWFASITLSGDNWIRILAALEGVDPDAIRAYLSLGGS